MDDDFRLFEDLGRWVRTKDATEARHGAAGSGENDLGFERFPRAGVDALIDRALAARGVAPAPVPNPRPTPPPDPPPRSQWWSTASFTLATTAAIVTTFMLSVPREGPPSASAPEPSPEPVSTPSFASVRIDGGGPSPAHQGPDRAPSVATNTQLICENRTVQIVLAATHGKTLDPAMPLEVTLEATPPWGPSRRFTHAAGPGERFDWIDDGRALIFSGLLEQVASLVPGPWTLQLSVGAPGACTQRGRGSGCSSLPVRTIEVIARDECDARR